ncbi:MAG TPA: FHA domain-containing protein [Candidatus Eisenbacteria bacterium]|jgi:pSer/pThr/pTyr-binding forkhead associated (FHA) protein
MVPADNDRAKPDPQTVRSTVRLSPRAERIGAEPFAAVRLEIVGGPMDGVTAHASSDVLVIGRSPRSDLCLHLDPLVSATHARIVRDGGGFWLEDLGSRNGTWIGEQRVRERMLIGSGTQFVLGNTCLEFTPAGGARSR